MMNEIYYSGPFLKFTQDLGLHPRATTEQVAATVPGQNLCDELLVSLCSTSCSKLCAAESDLLSVRSMNSLRASDPTLLSFAWFGSLFGLSCLHAQFILADSKLAWRHDGYSGLVPGEKVCPF